MTTEKGKKQKSSQAQKFKNEEVVIVELTFNVNGAITEYRSYGHAKTDVDCAAISLILQTPIYFGDVEDFVFMHGSGEFFLKCASAPSERTRNALAGMWAMLKSLEKRGGCQIVTKQQDNNNLH